MIKSIMKEGLVEDWWMQEGKTRSTIKSIEK